MIARGAVRRVCLASGLLLAGCGSSDRGTEPRLSADGDAAPAVRLGGETVSEEPWKFGGADGAILRTEHYRIYTTTRNGATRDRLTGFVEAALSHYRSALTPLPPPPIKLDVYLMANRAQWVGVTKALMGDQADMLVKIPRGGYASRGIGVYFDIGLFDTLAIAAHEGWHQYTQRTFTEGLPIWLEEGLATYMEGHRWNGQQPVFLAWANLERFDQLRKAAAAGSLQPLEALLESRPQDFLNQTAESAVTYYAQLWALAHFLHEGADAKYAPALREVLIDAARGGLGRRVALRVGPREASDAARRRGGPAVFLAYFNSDLAMAQREYDDFVRRLVETGSRGPITAGVSPISGR